MKSPKHKSLSASTNPTNHKMCADKQTKIGLSEHKVQAGIIPEEWEVKRLGDCIELVYGKGLPERARVQGNIPVFGSNGIVGFHNKALVQGPGIIIGRKGSVGEVTFSKLDFWPIDTTYFVNIKENNDIVFWYYFLKTLGLNQMNVHSAVPGLNRENVYEIISRIPPLPEQRAIAKILSDLDAKIELNREMNKTLEEIGKALFKRWFVDFEFPCLPDDYVSSGAREPNMLNKMKAVCTYRAVGGLPVPEKGKVFVYVLLCKDNSFYIGITDDLYRRWYEHKTGQGAKWTKANEPIKVIHYEVFTSRSDAAKREKELKTGFGRKWLKREYEKYLRKKSGLPASDNFSNENRAGKPAPECRLRQAGEMEYNHELGKEIPKGWRVGRLGEFIEQIESGSRPKGGSTETGIPSIGAENILGLGLYDYSSTKYVPIDFYENMKQGKIKDLDVLFYKDGAQLGRTSIFGFGFPFEKCCINEHVFIIRVKEPLNQMYLYFWSSLTSIKEEIINLNTNSAQPGITKEGVKSLKILIPSHEILSKFETLSKQIVIKVFKNCLQSLTLSQIRDALLPKLMTGKIRVPVHKVNINSPAHEVQANSPAHEVQAGKEQL